MANKLADKRDYLEKGDRDMYISMWVRWTGGGDDEPVGHSLGQRRSCLLDDAHFFSSFFYCSDDDDGIGSGSLSSSSSSSMLNLIHNWYAANERH